MRIIVIDDEECIRDTFKIYLEELGHEVITAEAPSDCDVFCSHGCCKGRPCGHVLFIDEYLPKTTGLQFVEEMIARGCSGVAKNLFIMSGNTDLVDKEKAEKMGCKILQKPVKFVELDYLLEECSINIDSDEMLAAI